MHSRSGILHVLCSGGGDTSCTVCLQQSRVGQGEVGCPIMNAPVLKAGQNAGDCYSALKFAVSLFGVDQRPLFFIFFPEFI